MYIWRMVSGHTVVWENTNKKGRKLSWKHINSTVRGFSEFFVLVSPGLVGKVRRSDGVWFVIGASRAALFTVLDKY